MVKGEGETYHLLLIWASWAWKLAAEVVATSSWDGLSFCVGQEERQAFHGLELLAVVPSGHKRNYLQKTKWAPDGPRVCVCVLSSHGRKVKLTSRNLINGGGQGSSRSI